MLRIDRFGPTKRLTMARSLGGRTFYHCHAYLVDGLLIDSGCPCVTRPFQGFLDSEEVTRAAITHYHEDHAGNVISLNLSGIPILAPQSSLDRIKRGIVNPFNKTQPYGLVFWGKSLGGLADPLPQKLETERHCFEVISSPGHSDDMQIFYEKKEGWLFSADLYIAARKIYWRKEENPLQAMAGIKKAITLDFADLFCGHSPVLGRGKEALQKKLEFMEEIQFKAKKLREEGFAISEISKKLLGREGVWTYLTLGDFSKRHFIEGLLSQPA
ncbi:MAG: hypothetical protein HY539_03160 [Deltaproteobacteria bacterium]|nr:hypothetical protein [Deltaproteobacteria bacterium]